MAAETTARGPPVPVDPPVSDQATAAMERPAYSNDDGGTNRTIKVRSPVMGEDVNFESVTDDVKRDSPRNSAKDDDDRPTSARISKLPRGSNVDVEDDKFLGFLARVQGNRIESQRCSLEREDEIEEALEASEINLVDKDCDDFPKETTAENRLENAPEKIETVDSLAESIPDASRPSNPPRLPPQPARILDSPPESPGGPLSPSHEEFMSAIVNFQATRFNDQRTPLPIKQKRDTPIFSFALRKEKRESPLSDRSSESVKPKRGDSFKSQDEDDDPGTGNQRQRFKAMRSKTVGKSGEETPMSETVVGPPTALKRKKPPLRSISMSATPAPMARAVPLSRRAQKKSWTTSLGTMEENLDADDEAFLELIFKSSSRLETQRASLTRGPGDEFMFQVSRLQSARFDDQRSQLASLDEDGLGAAEGGMPAGEGFHDESVAKSAKEIDGALGCEGRNGEAPSAAAALSANDKLSAGRDPSASQLVNFAPSNQPAGTPNCDAGGVMPSDSCRSAPSKNAVTGDAVSVTGTTRQRQNSINQSKSNASAFKRFVRRTFSKKAKMKSDETF